MTTHACRAGTGCADRRRDTDGAFAPAPTEIPNTLCSHCHRRVTLAAGDLWSDYLALDRMVADPTLRPRTTSGVHSTPTPPIPIDIHADALAREIATEVHRAAEAISDRLHCNPPGSNSIGACIDLVEANVDVLLAVPAITNVDSYLGGETWTINTIDGPTLALRLVDLHRRARLTLAIDQGRDRLPLPCPICEDSTIGRWHGSTDVDCRACGSIWTATEYRQMTDILAVDYAEFDPRPGGGAA